MSDHEILLELLAEKRRNDRQRTFERIVTLVVIVALIALILVINSKFSHAMQQIQGNIDRINTATGEITSFFAGFKEAGYENAEQALEDLHNATTKINTFFNTLGEHGLQNIEQGVDAITDVKGKIVGLFNK